MKKLFPLLLVFLFLSGCSKANSGGVRVASNNIPRNVIQNTTTTQTQVQQPGKERELLMGNTNANLAEDGLAVATENGTAYVDGGGKKLVCGGKTLVTGEKIHQLNYQDGTFYYLDGCKVMSLKNAAGKTLYTIGEDYETATLIAKDELYLSWFDSESGIGGKLLVIRADGSTKMLSDNANGQVSLYDGKLYYGHPGGSGIWRVDVNGVHDEQILADDAPIFFVENGKLYFTRDHEGIFAYDLALCQTQRLYQGSVTAMNMQKGNLIFTDGDGLLYRMGDSNALISESYYSNIQVAGGKLFGLNSRDQMVEITE